MGMCAFKVFRHLKCFSQTLHINVLSTLWVCACKWKCNDRCHFKDFLQTSQANGCSLQWICRWLLKISHLVKDFFTHITWKRYVTPMCADMQYEVLLVFVTLLTHVITKMPIYTNRVQMHFHDTLKYKTFLTHITWKCPLTGMSVYVNLQALLILVIFLTHIRGKGQIPLWVYRCIFKTLWSTKDFLHT
jgi:hypothetical protein